MPSNRFLREAKAAAILSHSNICHVYEIDEAEGKTFLAMEFVEGERLENRIAKGPLALKDALDIGRQLADGLASSLTCAFGQFWVMRNGRPGSDGTHGNEESVTYRFY